MLCGRSASYFRHTNGIFSIIWVGTGLCARPQEVGTEAHPYKLRRYANSAKDSVFSRDCTGQDEGEMTIFTAKVQRSKEAKKQGEVSIFCLFAPLPLCRKKFHHQFDRYSFFTGLIFLPATAGKQETCPTKTNFSKGFFL